MKGDSAITVLHWEKFLVENKRINKILIISIQNSVIIIDHHNWTSSCVSGIVDLIRKV